MKKMDSDYMIESILHKKIDSENEETYLIKQSKKSYIHSKWWNEEELLNYFDNAEMQLPKFNNNYVEQKGDDNIGKEYFNPKYKMVERILDIKKDKYFIKWCDLPFIQCTWEKKSDLMELTGNINEIEELIEKYEARIDSALEKKAKIVRNSKDFEKFFEVPKFNNENKLRDYQEEGFKWLCFSWFNRTNTILADEMGLGKTLQALSIIHYINTAMKVKGPFLIVAPLSTIEQWKREIKLWTYMDCLVYYGDINERESIQNILFLRDTDKVSYDIVLTSYEMLSKDIDTFNSIKWNFLICDEAHRMKNSNSNTFTNLSSIKTSHKLLMTGTPVQNNMEELFTLLSFLHPEKFDDKEAFLEDYGDLKDFSKVQKLQNLLSPYLLRRMKEDVEKTLPNKIETIINLELTSIQKTMYKAVLEKNADFLRSVTNHRKTSLNMMMNVRKICNHPYLIQGAEFGIKKANENEDELYNIVRSSSKMVLLDKLLKKLQSEKRKVLIFSQFTMMLDVLEDYMAYSNFKYVRLDGQVDRISRQDRIDEFCDPNSDLFVFIISTKAGGIGINLQVSDTVIIFDSDWNPQNDIQAISRSHRIGQKNVVQIYRLITKGTYEEYMFQVASKKLGLDCVVLGNFGSKDAFEEKSVDEINIEKLLKFGAYFLYTDKENGENNLVEEDIESILKSRTVVIDHNVKSEQDGNNPRLGVRNLSKATFTLENSSDISLDDKNFWDKILVHTHTPISLFSYMEKIGNDPNFDREKFVIGIKQVYTHILEDKKSKLIDFDINDRITKFIMVLENVSKNSFFNEKQQKMALSFLDHLKNDRKKKVNYKETKIIKGIDEIVEENKIKSFHEYFYEAIEIFGPFQYTKFAEYLKDSTKVILNNIALRSNIENFIYFLFITSFTHNKKYNAKDKRIDGLADNFDFFLRKVIQHEFSANLKTSATVWYPIHSFTISAKAQRAFLSATPLDLNISANYKKSFNFDDDFDHPPLVYVALSYGDINNFVRIYEIKNPFLKDSGTTNLRIYLPGFEGLYSAHVIIKNKTSGVQIVTSYENNFRVTDSKGLKKISKFVNFMYSENKSFLQNFTTLTNLHFVDNSNFVDVKSPQTFWDKTFDKKLLELVSKFGIKDYENTKKKMMSFHNKKYEKENNPKRMETLFTKKFYNERIKVLAQSFSKAKEEEVKETSSSVFHTEDFLLSCQGHKIIVPLQNHYSSFLKGEKNFQAPPKIIDLTEDVKKKVVKKENGNKKVKVQEDYIIESDLLNTPTPKTNIKKREIEDGENGSSNKKVKTVKEEKN